MKIKLLYNLRVQERESVACTFFISQEPPTLCIVKSVKDSYAFVTNH
jgi:hypothetical protein